MHLDPTVTLIGLVLTTAAVPPFAVAKPAVCDPPRYVVTEGVARLGGAPPAPVVLAVTGRRVSLSGGCRPTRARRRGTRIVATWARCGSLSTLRLDARLPATCDTITGTLTAKDAAPIPFAAAPSRCGDGVVDAGAAEQCDATACADGGVCAACSCGAAACAASAVPNEGWIHVPVGTDIHYAHNPPASGPHYPIWARYREHTATVPRGYWVHDLEHGAIVLLYRPDAGSAVIDAMRAAYAALPPDAACGHERALLTPDPLLDRPFAVVAANSELRCDVVSQQAILDFATVHRGHGPEDACADGSYP